MAGGGGYEPTPDYVQNSMNPLLDISLNDSTELWLIQLPSNSQLDFDGQEVTLNLNNNGALGAFKNSSGKEYELVSFESQEPDASVFLSSTSDSKIVGKISRRVSLVHYPEASELEKKNRPSRMQQGSVSASRHRYNMSLTQGSRQRSASGISHVTANPTRSLFKSGDPTKRPKKRYAANEPMRSADRSTQESQGKSDVTSGGSAGHPHQGKSKKVRKEE